MFSEMMGGIFLIFCRSNFITNFCLQFLGRVKSPKVKYPHTVLKITDFFFKKKKFFHWPRAFFTTAKPLIWASYLHTKKFLTFFFQVWIFKQVTQTLKAFLKELRTKNIQSFSFENTLTSTIFAGSISKELIKKTFSSQ